MSFDDAFGDWGTDQGCNVHCCYICVQLSYHTVTSACDAWLSASPFPIQISGPTERHRDYREETVATDSAIVESEVSKFTVPRHPLIPVLYKTCVLLRIDPCVTH